MLKKRRLIQFSIIILAIFIFLPDSAASAYIGDDEWQYAQASCQLVDHNWLIEDYLDLDANSPIYFGSFSLGGIGFTFDIDYVQPGSVWTVNFNDQFELETTVDEFGRAMVNYGLWSYGNYEYTSTFISPTSSEAMDGPLGIIVVGAEEFLDCSLQFLPYYVYPATSTPEPAPTEEPMDSFAPTPTTLVETNIEDNQELDSDAPFYDAFVSYILSSWYLLCCCVFLLVFLIFGIVIIVVRRTRPETYARIRSRLKF